MRLAAVYQKRGDNKHAAGYYRQAVTFMDQQGFDDELKTSLREQADKLDPPTT